MRGVPTDCGEWVIASTVAFAVTVATSLLWLDTGRRWWWAAGTRDGGDTAVPAYRAAFAG